MSTPIQIELIKYMLMAQDMSRAMAFYRDALGLAVKFESPGWTELTFGDSIVALHGGGSGARTETGLSFQVTDLPAACARVSAHGGVISQPPQTRPGEPIMLAKVVDPEGNQFMMTQYVG